MGTDYEGEKTKLTLGIDKAVIKKAKQAGINISSITEQLLRAMTFDASNGESYDDIVKYHKVFLNAIQQILGKYNTWIEVGKRKRLSYVDSEVIEDRINLTGLEGPYIVNDEADNVQKVPLGEILNDLYSPNEILVNLLKQLVKVSEDSKERLRELNFALKFLKTLSEEEKEDTE